MEPTQCGVGADGGQGTLADACYAEGAINVHCMEIDPDSVAHLIAEDHFVTEEDFLKTEPKPIYDRIVMHPPSTRRQDYKHVRHALGYLTPGGRLVAITATNWTPEMVAELAKHGDIITTEVPPCAFKASGTAVGAAIRVLQKASSVAKKGQKARK